MGAGVGWHPSRSLKSRLRRWIRVGVGDEWKVGLGAAAPSVSVQIYEKCGWKVELGLFSVFAAAAAKSRRCRWTFHVLIHEFFGKVQDAEQEVG